MSKFEKLASVFALIGGVAFLTALFTITSNYENYEAVIAYRAYLHLDLGISIIGLVASGVCLLVAKFTGK